MICPKCKKEFYDPPAISIEDNKTKICVECVIIEAITIIEPDKKKAQEFINSILGYEKGAEEEIQNDMSKQKKRI